MTSEVEERPRLVTGGYWRHRSQWVKIKLVEKSQFSFKKLHQLPLYRLFQIVLSVFPSSSDASTHFHIEIPSINCWRAVARQPSILYNSAIWRKSVECKIVDLRNRISSLYQGACGFRGMRSRFLYIRDMRVNAHGNIDQNSSSSRNQGRVKRSDVCCLWKDSSRS